MKKCEDCDECVYICEGDFACMKEEPRIILVPCCTTGRRAIPGLCPTWMR